VTDADTAALDAFERRLEVPGQCVCRSVDENKFEVELAGVEEGGEWTVARPGIVSVLPCDRFGNPVDAATAAEVPFSKYLVKVREWSPR
jgi:hypothetical protein